ncbi:MAG: ABC transporter ATP-binding protein/permease [Pseudomonadota bacterium]
MKNKAVRLREFQVFLGRTFNLVKPYWVSEDRRTGWFLLLSVLAVEGLLLYLITKLSFATAGLFNAIEQRSFDVIWNAILVWLGYLSGMLIMYVLQVHVQNKLIIHWRRFLTQTYLRGYLDNHLYNQLELGDYKMDNPDQRISMDMLNIAQETLELGLQFISALGKLSVFSFILWSVSGPMEFSVFGVAIVIPGYMFWVALIFSVVGTWLAHTLAHPLSRLNFDRQAVEADFRYHLVRLRENAESIALLGGEGKEYDDLNTRFASIWDNWMVIIKYKRRLMAFDFGLSQGGTLVPFIAAMPALVAGTIALGGFMQLSQAFMQVQLSLSWFAKSYEKLAVWKSSVDRVLTLDDAFKAARAEQKASRVLRHSVDKELVSIKGVTLNLPTGDPLLENVSFKLEKGTDVLISGPSGGGKSTLFRLFSGLWIWGEGSLTLPTERTMFLPQRPYLPISPLREVLTYPNQNQASIEPERIEDVMRLCRLEKFIGSLDQTRDWARVLSGGEQQRVSMARAFLAKPEWLFLDEATASMDPDTEAAIYHALKSELPNTTLVSIAHRESLRAHHDLEIKLDPETRSLSGAQAAV